MRLDWKDRLFFWLGSLAILIGIVALGFGGLTLLRTFDAPPDFLAAARAPRPHDGDVPLTIVGEDPAVRAAREARFAAMDEAIAQEQAAADRTRWEKGRADRRSTGTRSAAFGLVLLVVGALAARARSPRRA